MLLTRTAFKQIMALDKLEIDELPDHTQKAMIQKLNYILEKFPHISEIEGVKNLNGAKYLLMQRVISTLERLGETVDELTLDQLTIQSFLETEPLIKL